MTEAWVQRKEKTSGEAWPKQKQADKTSEINALLIRQKSSEIVSHPFLQMTRKWMGTRAVLSCRTNRAFSGGGTCRCRLAYKMQAIDPARKQ
jgi:hypothetical protein